MIQVYLVSLWNVLGRCVWRACAYVCFGVPACAGVYEMLLICGFNARRITYFRILREKQQWQKI